MLAFAQDWDLALCSLPFAPALDLSLLLLPQPTSKLSALPFNDLSSKCSLYAVMVTVCFLYRLLVMGNTDAH